MVPPVPSNGTAHAVETPSAPAPYAPPPEWRWDRNLSHRSLAVLPIFFGTFLLPRAICVRTAEWVGAALARTFGETRRVLGGNFRRLGAGSFPDAEVARLVRRTMGNWGRCVVDAMYLARGGPGHVRRLISELSGGEILTRTMARGHGVVLITPHLGFWELGGAVLALEGYPLSVVTGVVPDPRVRAIKHGFRERFGIRHIYVTPEQNAAPAMLGILDALRRNEIVAMLPDRAHGADLAEVAYCGSTARFPTGPAWLALRTGAALLPAYVVRDGSRYRAIIEEPILPPAVDPHERTTAVAELTQTMARCFEGIVRRYPDQWYNFYPAWAGNGA